MAIAENNFKLQKQTGVGNMLARTSSFGSNQGGSGSSATSSSSGVTRQGSQGSLLEQFTHQAKGLVNRQGSQEGILAHMDKVNRTFCYLVSSPTAIPKRKVYLLNFSSMNCSR